MFMRLPHMLAPAFCWFCLSTGPITGQEAPTGEDLPLAAVGWIGYGAMASPEAGKANCTGVLIAPDIVVTAGHCVIDPATGAPARPEAVTFRAGQGPAGSLAPRQGRSVRLLEEPPQSPAAKIGQELAFVTLDRPFTAEEARPLPLADAPPALGTRLAMLGYDRRAPDAPAVQPGCAVRLTDGLLFGLDCHAVSGYSGGPVLTEGTEGWRLAGIMVAEARAAPRLGALALWLDPALVDDADAGE